MALLVCKEKELFFLNTEESLQVPFPGEACGVCTAFNNLLLKILPRLSVALQVSVWLKVQHH